MTTIQIDTGDGPMAAYLARPAAPAGRPALVLIQEIFGINQVMRDAAAFFAGHGFSVLVPDLFWRIEPGVDLSDRTQAEWQRAFALMNAFDTDKGIADIDRTIATARTLEGASGKVGCVGYCLGGKLAYLTAARTGIDASVGYYGVMIDQILGEARGIRRPLMLHIAGKDQFVPPAAQAAMHAGLESNPLVTLCDYPAQDHAFARPGGQHYDAAAADEANARTIVFLQQHLA